MDDNAPEGGGSASTLDRRTLLAGAAGAALAATTGTARAQQATPSASPMASPVADLAAAGGPKFGFVLAHEQFRTPDLVEFAVLAEQAGFDEVWTSDHSHPWQDNQGHAMFPWITLALIGARTERIVFGTGVTCPTYRHVPSQVAQAFASLGVMSPGRVYLGAGTGEALNELAFAGAFGPYQERADRWVEAIDLIRRLWSGDWVEFQGTYYQAPVTKLYDVPEQPIPIYMAASGPNSARLAGQHGDGWITGAADLLKKPELLRAFREGAAAAGKDPLTLPVRAESFVTVGGEAEAREAARLWHFTPKSWTKDFLYDPDPRSIQRKAEEQIPLEEVYQDWPIGEDPAPHVEGITELLRAGASHVYIHSGQQDQRKVIEFYGSEVLPRVRGA